MNVVKFAYYDEFHCIGPECTDSCCKHWSINISKREYLNYKKMKCSPELHSVIDTAFKRRKKTTEIAFAEMRLKENGDCPFLREDSLCMLQKELGEGALSFTCSAFPRLHSCVGDGETVLKSCSTTCSHVIEILMNHSEGLSIVEEEYDKKDKNINIGKYSSIVIHKTWKGFPYYWSILNAEIDILQNRTFNISERMLILGYFCKKADEYIENDEGEKIPGMTEMLLDNELCKKIVDSLKPSQSADVAAAKSMEILLKMHSRIQTLDSGLPKKLFQQVMERLGYVLRTEQAVADFNAEEYYKLCGTFRKLESERSYIIENLLVNLAFQSNLEDGIWKNYFTFAIFYNVLKICAPVFLPENYDDKALAQALTYAVKMVLNTNLAKGGTCMDFFITNKYTLPYAVLLIC